MAFNKKSLNPTTNKWAAVVGMLLAALLLLVSNSAFWFNRYIFNRDNFTSIATQSLLSESSRQAMGDELSSRLLSNRPALNNVLADPLSKQIAAILNTNFIRKNVERTVSKLHTITTTKDPQNVSLDIASLKENITKILDVASNISGKSLEKPEETINQLPDEIVLIDAQNFPNIYNIGVALLWLGPITFVLALLLLFLPLYWYRKQRVDLIFILIIDGVAVCASALIAYLLGPLFKPPLLSSLKSDNTRIVVGNLYDAFIGKFNDQITLLFVLGIVLILIGVSFWLKPKLFENKNGNKSKVR